MLQWNQQPKKPKNSMKLETINALQAAGVHTVIVHLKGGDADKKGASVSMELQQIKDLLETHDVDVIDMSIDALAKEIEKENNNERV